MAVEKRSCYMILICYLPCQKRFVSQQQESLEPAGSNIELLELSAAWRTIWEPFRYVFGGKVIWKGRDTNPLFANTLSYTNRHFWHGFARTRFVRTKVSPTHTRISACSERMSWKVREICRRSLTVVWNTSFKTVLLNNKPITIFANVINGFYLRLIFEFFTVWRLTRFRAIFVGFHGIQISIEITQSQISNRIENGLAGKQQTRALCLAVLLRNFCYAAYRTSKAKKNIYS